MRLVDPELADPRHVQIAHAAEALVGDGPPHHELFLMCADIDETLERLRGKGAALARPVTDEGWGRVAYLDVPGIGELGLYEPRHASPRQA